MTEHEHRIVLRLCHTSKCCPEVTIAHNGTVTITDDDGGSVTLLPEHALLLMRALRETEFPRRY